MKEIENRLAALIKRDMERRNREAGFRMFKYVDTVKIGPFMWVEYLYRDSPYSDPVKIHYGGNPFVSKANVMKEYLEECVQEEGYVPRDVRTTDFYEKWFSGRGW